jgi:hypothetical protein
MTACVVGQNATHHLSGYPKEMRLVLPLRLCLVNQSQIGFVYQRRALQRMVGALAPKVATGQTLELGVNQWHERLERLVVAVLPFLE